MGKNLILPDEEDRIRIQKIYNYTKDKKHFFVFNEMYKRVSKRQVYTTSFRIATELNYLYKNTYKREKYINHKHMKQFSRMYNHNARVGFQKNDYPDDFQRDRDVRDYVNPQDYQKLLLIEKGVFMDTKDELKRKLKALKLNLKRANEKDVKDLEKIKKLELEIQECSKKYEKFPRIRKNAKLTQEIVINVRDNTEIVDIERAFIKIREQIPILQKSQLVNISIHRDEGYITLLDRQLQKNHHAHLIFHNIDLETGKTIFGKLRKKDIFLIKDILSKELNMERCRNFIKTKHEYKKTRKERAEKAYEIITNKDFIKEMELVVERDKIDSKLNVTKTKPLHKTTKFIESNTQSEIDNLIFNAPKLENIPENLEHQMLESTQYHQPESQESTEFSITGLATENYYNEVEIPNFKSTPSPTQNLQNLTTPQPKKLTQDSIKPNHPNTLSKLESSAKLRVQNAESSAELVNPKVEPKRESKIQIPPQTTTAQPIQPIKTTPPIQTTQILNDIPPIKPVKTEIEIYADNIRALLDFNKNYTARDTELQNLDSDIQKWLNRLPQSYNDTNGFLNIITGKKNNKSLPDNDRENFQHFYDKYMQQGSYTQGRELICREYINDFCKRQINYKCKKFNERLEIVKTQKTKQESIENTNKNQKKLVKIEFESKKSRIQESTIKKAPPKTKSQDKSHGFSR